MSRSSDLRSNQIIREAIQKIALHGLVDPHTNSVHGTGRTTGFAEHLPGDPAERPAAAHHRPESGEAHQGRIGKTPEGGIL